MSDIELKQQLKGMRSLLEELITSSISFADDISDFKTKKDIVFLSGKMIGICEDTEKKMRKILK